MKKLLKIILYPILGLIVLTGLYLLAAVILSRITVAEESGARDEIAIYLLTNGVHSDIVMPARNDQMDWNTFVPFSNTTGKDTLAQYLAVGWGDKGFYLQTPTWADLKFSTAFKAMFALSTAAMHTTYYREMYEGDDCIRIMISREQYARLVDYIRSGFQRHTDGSVMHIRTNANYSSTDAFYEAKGRYNLFYTCNTWTNDALKSCGQRACLWTAFDKGIFYQYRR